MPKMKIIVFSLATILLLLVPTAMADSLSSGANACVNPIGCVGMGGIHQPRSAASMGLLRAVRHFRCLHPVILVTVIWAPVLQPHLTLQGHQHMPTL